MHGTMDRRIAVTGATGNVGRPLVEALLDRDVRVRAAVPEPSRRDDLECEQVAFDFEEPETWSGTFEGADGLFLLRPPHLSNVERDMFPALEAAVEDGVDHVVVLSVMGAGKNPFLPHRRLEKRVEELDVAFTHVRPGFYMQNLTGTNRASIARRDEIVVPAGSGRANFVDARDVGELAAAALAERDPHVGDIYEPTGPEAIDHHRVASILTEVLGREIRYDEPGILRYIGQMRRDTDHELGLILFSSLLYTLIRLGRSTRITDDVEFVLGRPPRTFREFARDHAEAWRTEEPAART